MNEVRAVHECLFCPQTFGSAAAKDDHVLGHFAHETCSDCDQTLIRIGERLYTLHNAVTCIKQESKFHEQIEQCIADQTQLHTECQQQEVDLNNLKYDDDSDNDTTTASLYLMSDQIAPVAEISHAICLEEIQIKSESMPEDEDPRIISDTHDSDDYVQHPTNNLPELCTSNEQTQEKPHTKIPEKSTKKTTFRKKGVIKDINKRTVCTICGKIIHSSSIYKHKIVKHNIKKKSDGNFQCHICQLVSVEEQRIHKHIQREHARVKFHFIDSSKTPQTNADTLRTEKQSIQLNQTNAHDFDENVQQATNNLLEPCTSTKVKPKTPEKLMKKPILRQRGVIKDINKQSACTICGQVMHSGSVYRHKFFKHKIRKKSNGNYQCNICQLVSVDEVGLHEHIQREHARVKFHFIDSSKMPQTDDDILRKEEQSVELNQTNANDSEEVRDVLQVNALRRDSRKSRPITNEKKRSACDICGKEMHKHSVTKHKKKYHNVIETVSSHVYGCMNCNEIFIDQPTYEQHRCSSRMHVDVDEEDDDDFGGINSDNNHRKEEQSVELNQANANDLGEVRNALQVNATLRRDLRKSRPITNEKMRSACDFCGKEMHKYSVTKHKKKYHNVIETVSSHVYRCMHCKEIFIDQPTYEQHRCSSRMHVDVDEEDDDVFGGTNSDNNDRTNVIAIPSIYLNSDATPRTKASTNQSEQQTAPMLPEGDFQYPINPPREYNSTRRVVKNVADRVECDVCGRIIHKKSLRKHKSAVHGIVELNIGEEHIECKVCYDIFADRSALNAHQCKRQNEQQSQNAAIGLEELQTKGETMEADSLNRDDANEFQRNEQPTIDCDVCSKSFSDQYTLNRHKIALHCPKNHFCRICGRKFFTFDELNKHASECSFKKNVPFSTKIGVFQCDICKAVLNHKESVRRHMKIKHNPNYKQFKCEKCSKIFVMESSLETHNCRPEQHKIRQKSHHDVNVMCDLCGKLIRKSSLPRHKIIKHSDPNAIICKFCVTTFETKEQLMQHQPDCRLKRNRQDCIGLGKLFECYVCKKKLKTKPCLINHMKWKHVDMEEEIKCPLCEKVFHRMAIYKTHHNLVHLNIRKFLCAYCGHSCKSKLALQYHVYHHTGERPFKCEVCKKGFRTPAGKAEHLRVHTKEKPFHCVVDGCGQRFSFGVDFRRHKYKAHGIFTKQFPCEICNQIFPENSILKKHMQKVHG